MSTSPETPVGPSGPVMYIIVNNDLKMGKGKIAGQVGHAIEHVITDIHLGRYDNPTIYKDYVAWKMTGHSKKIVLKGTQSQLESLMNDPDHRHVNDAGFTQISPGSLTVVGFPPSYTRSEQFKEYSLL